MPKDDKIRIVAIGGGTGLSTLLHGLKQISGCVVGSDEPGPPLDLTALVTVTDDGGSSGRLRRDFAILPPGDIRNCLVAMSQDETLLSTLFQYRFSSGKGLKGHSLGNLFLTALTELSGGDFALAVQRASEVLATCGRIYPSTSANVSLEAVLESGEVVQGESKISRSRERIRRIRLLPGSPDPMPETLEAIAKADLITFGPGSLFTSVVPNLLVKGIAEAIHASGALKVCLVNLMSQPGETLQFTASDHVRAINDHARCRLVDVAVVNSKPIPALLQNRYARRKAHPIENDAEAMAGLGVRVITRELAADGPKVRHNPEALAEVAVELAIQTRRARLQALTA